MYVCIPEFGTYLRPDDQMNEDMCPDTVMPTSATPPYAHTVHKLSSSHAQTGAWAPQAPPGTPGVAGTALRKQLGAWQPYSHTL